VQAVGRYAAISSELLAAAERLDRPERDRMRREADEAVTLARSTHSALDAHRAEHRC
jgi:hypothetical protein